MSSAQSAWRLQKVVVTDLLGFQGTKEFTFQAGLQVIEAPNHTGKTSFTMALLWALTGSIPNLARINKQSFRLTNKHAGDNACPAVSAGLAHDDGRQLVIKRKYQPRPDLDTDLTVELADCTFTGQQAQELIFAELGMKPESLEGCGVVLQDHRLGLITGKASDISDVINDVLGLYSLSQLVPALEASSKSANDLKKEIHSYLEIANPIVKWDERNTQLLAELHQLENGAIEAGFPPESLEDHKSSALQELTGVATQLGASPQSAQSEVAAEVERLRNWLAGLRKASPISGEIATLQGRKECLKEWGKTARAFEERLAEHDQKLATESAKGEMDSNKLASNIAEKETALERNEQRRSALEQEHGFLTTCYDHLLLHQDAAACPLCLNSIEPESLLASVKHRVTGAIASELERLQAEFKMLTENKRATDKRLSLVREMRENHQGLMQRLAEFKEQVQHSGLSWSPSIQMEDLFLDSKARQKLLADLREIISRLSQEETTTATQLKEREDSRAQQETELFQPAEVRINLIRDHFVALIAAAQKLETHGKLRQKAEAQKSSLESLFEETSKVSGYIKKISAAISEHEEAAATGAIKAQLPQISELFRKIAGNPDYDALSIQTSINRDKVTYRIQATSSQTGNLNDTVGHVLSEGDLSSAGIALLVGLAAGQVRRMGFLVLDDPAQGMDDTLQANFAGVLASLDAQKQVIILTHQRSFATALKNAGASHTHFSGWKSGRIT